jgi:uncharacterized peroxidase-related enzyme
MNSRLEPVDPRTATGEAKMALDKVKAHFGMWPNLTRVLANSPAALNAFLGFSGALSHGLLPPALREQLALVVGQENDCSYCLAAHTAIGGMVGLDKVQITAARRGQAQDPRTAAALRFARLLVVNRGQTTDQDLHDLRAAGYSDGEIAEIVAHVALNIFTNYFNHVAQTVVDFPAAPPLASLPGASN